ncbi:hypothetical protein NPIL_80361 [Nephila pilipes]|uniref:Uncharacterized protein n=1 Tax=Nephila pilipes TaxID=299642 RepID=A0A8X6M9R9_NEPPI|nr:hypothetical protein NPIL_80361 [Nephila pilipes]
MAARMTSTEVSEYTLKFISDLQKEGKHPFLVWVMKLGLTASLYSEPSFFFLSAVNQLQYMKKMPCRKSNLGHNTRKVKSVRRVIAHQTEEESTSGNEKSR